jgi:hypothetical protein
MESQIFSGALFFWEVKTFAVVPSLVLALSSRWGSGRRGELFVAWSADDLP